MGRGNWIPAGYDDRCNHETVYAEVIGLDYEAEEFEIEESYRDFRRTVKAALPESMQNENATAYCRHYETLFEVGRDDRIIACNDLVAVVCDAQGDLWHMGVAVVYVGGPKRGIASKHADNVAKRLWAALAENYKLSKRDGAWTSKPFDPRPQAAAA